MCVKPNICPTYTITSKGGARYLKRIFSICQAITNLVYHSSSKLLVNTWHKIQNTWNTITGTIQNSDLNLFYIIDMQSTGRGRSYAYFRLRPFHILVTLFCGLAVSSLFHTLALLSRTSVSISSLLFFYFYASFKKT